MKKFIIFLSLALTHFALADSAFESPPNAEDVLPLPAQFKGSWELRGGSCKHHPRTIEEVRAILSDNHRDILVLSESQYSNRIKQHRGCLHSTVDQSDEAKNCLRVGNDGNLFYLKSNVVKFFEGSTQSVQIGSTTYSPLLGNLVISTKLSREEEVLTIEFSDFSNQKCEGGVNRAYYIPYSDT